MKKSSRLVSEINHFSKLPHVWWGTKTVAGQRRYDNKAKLFKKLCKIKKKDKILEIGCGDGEFTKRLTDLDNKIFAIDATPQLIKLAKKNIKAKNIAFLVQDAENLTLKNSSLDIICGISILHHLNCERALREIYRVLKPNGRIFFTEPNLLNPNIWVGLHIPWLRSRMEFSHDETALTRWKVKEILKSIGFKKILVRNYDFLHPLTPIYLINLVDKIGEVLVQLPVIKEVSGSIVIWARK